MGYLAIVLHAHLPFVRHADGEDYLEEKWFYEALIETYIPLYIVLSRLAAEGVPYRICLLYTSPQALCVCKEVP